MHERGSRYVLENCAALSINGYGGNPKDNRQVSAKPQSTPQDLCLLPKHVDIYKPQSTPQDGSKTAKKDFEFILVAFEMIPV